MCSAHPITNDELIPCNNMLASKARGSLFLRMDGADAMVDINVRQSYYTDYVKQPLYKTKNAPKNLKPQWQHYYKFVISMTSWNDYTQQCFYRCEHLHAMPSSRTSIQHIPAGCSPGVSSTPSVKLLFVNNLLLLQQMIWNFRTALGFVEYTTTNFQRLLKSKIGKYVKQFRY
jgi:hypothetical protein